MHIEHKFRHYKRNRIYNNRKTSKIIYYGTKRKHLLIGSAVVGAAYLLCKKKGVSGIGTTRDWWDIDPDERLITNYGDGEYGQQAKEFALKNNVKLYVLAETYDYYFPDDKRQRSIYKMKLTRDGKSYTFTFGQSIANTGKLPSYYDVLAALTKSDPYSFEDFCADYGYEQWNESYTGRNKQSYQTYKAVKREYENVVRLFGDVIEELEEIY